MANAQTKRVHAFETPTAERFFKALLWVVLILQVVVFTKAYQKLVRQHPERSNAAAWRQG